LNSFADPSLDFKERSSEDNGPLDKSTELDLPDNASLSPFHR
jgi:hypothetical protein